MGTMNFYTTLQLGLLNAWIPLLCLVLIQMLYLILMKEGGRRAVDTSWYTPTDRRNFRWNSRFQTILVFLSIFIPLKIGTVWFTVGASIYAFALIGFISAFQAYTTAAPNKTITKGIYSISRNPMYFSFNLGVLGICIASASLPILIVSTPIFVATHLIIKGEEKYCERTYGHEYQDYKGKVARYFWFF